jgi:lysyl-tRNA synthetase, class II
MEESIYERERRDKVQKLRDLGVEPYGAAVTGLTPLADIKAQYKPEMGHDGGPTVKGAGRIMLKRDMGKLSFLTLRDESGDLQVAFDKKRLDEKLWAVNNLLDLGDQLVVEGALGVTKKGEVTIWATTLAVASKALLPPPAKWEGLSDVELRYRQRYVDLWANPEVMRTLKLRMQIVDEVRTFLKSKGFLEVETPMMQPLAGGAAARPFTTKHNALGIDLFLRIAPELYLKRLLVGGFTKVFELNRNFRNEGISPRHNPEFTMLEAYEAFGSWETMADLVEEMICGIAEKLFGGLKIEHKAADGTVRRTIDLKRPWRRVTMAQLVEERTGWRFNQQLLTKTSDALDGIGNAIADHIKRMTKDTVEVEDVSGGVEKLRANYDRWAAKQGLADFEGGQVSANLFKILHHQPSAAQQLVEVYEKLIEPTLIDPTYVTQVPSVIIPLARKNPSDPLIASS